MIAQLKLNPINHGKLLTDALYETSITWGGVPPRNTTVLNHKYINFAYHSSKEELFKILNLCAQNKELIIVFQCGGYWRYTRWKSILQ